MVPFWPFGALICPIFFSIFFLFLLGFFWIVWLYIYINQKGTTEMNTTAPIAVTFYSTSVIEQEGFTFTCRFCHRDGLTADYAMLNNPKLGRYENLCITCADEMRFTIHEDMKAIREALTKINN